jgi:hypothetical protein
MKNFKFKIYWSEHEITYFSTQALNYDEAFELLKKFLGQDWFKFGYTLMD